MSQITPDYSNVHRQDLVKNLRRDYSTLKNQEERRAMLEFRSFGE